MLQRPFSKNPHVLLVDLNNFSRFPTLPVGLIAAVLRKNRVDVEVLSPLAVGAPGVPRPTRASPWGYVDERLRWWSATTPSRSIRAAREIAGNWRPFQRAARGRRLMRAFRDALARAPRVVLISSYLIYHEAVRRMCAAAAELRIPVLLGGPAFHESSTRLEWMRTPGLTGIFAGEAEAFVVELLERVTRSAPPPLQGLTRSSDQDGGVAAPLHDLDGLPYPDYDDFPWDLYPNRIVSMLTARGCQWGACTFCSDVVTVAGRTFRTRSLDNVLGELAHHRERYETSLFCFSDLKLNSNLDIWRGLHEHFPSVVSAANWTCAVHVGPRRDEGLSFEDLRRARRAGLVRVTTGLESGSQTMLDAMRKGTTPERMEAFLAAAHEAGISTRVTAFTGYPGETASEVEETTGLLQRVSRYLDRVHLSRLLIQSGTPLEGEVLAQGGDLPGIHSLRPQPLQAVSSHVNAAATKTSYKRAIRRLLRVVHSINREPLAGAAGQLEGAM
jgi:hypothetical protein